jgi:phosphoglycolate phosphatase
MKSFIFDLDGTLVSVKPEYRYQLLAAVLAEFGKTISKDHIDRFWFMPHRDALLRQWGLHPDKFWNTFRTHDLPKTRKPYTFVFDDITYLSQLKKAGHKLALFTGSPPVIVKMELSFLDRRIFDAIVIASPSTGITPKPHPMGATECLRLLGCERKDTIYVGNSDEDILTARNAGIFLVLIDRGEHKHTLVPDAIISSLAELQKL